MIWREHVFPFSVYDVPAPFAGAVAANTPTLLLLAPDDALLSPPQNFIPLHRHLELLLRSDKSGLVFLCWRVRHKGGITPGYLFLPEELM